MSREDSVSSIFDDYKFQAEQLEKNPAGIDLGKLEELEEKVAQGDRIFQSDINKQQPRLSWTSADVFDDFKKQVQKLRQLYDVQHQQPRQPNQDRWSVFSQLLDERIALYKEAAMNFLVLRADKIDQSQVEDLSRFIINSRRFLRMFSKMASVVNDPLKKIEVESQQKQVDDLALSVAEIVRRVDSVPNTKLPGTKEIIDLATWDTKDHPVEARNLLNETNKYSQKLADPDYTPTRNDIAHLERLMQLLNEDVLSAQGTIHDQYANPQQVRRFLESYYLLADPSDPTHRMRASEVLSHLKKRIKEKVRENIILTPGLAEVEAEISNLSISDDLTEIEKSIRNLTASLTILRSMSVDAKGLADTGDEDGAREYITELITKSERKLKDLDNKRFEKKREKEPSEITDLEEISQEVMKKGINPFWWDDWEKAPDERNRRLVIRFRELLLVSEPDDRDKYLEILKWKTRVQLHVMNNKLQNENESTSSDRTKLFEWAGRTLLTRQELILATTGNPQYGKEINEILDDVISAASDKDDKRLSYEALTDQKQGRTTLENFINSYHSNTSEDARKFASLLFNVFCLLDIVLRNQQKKTKTRGHNGGLKDTDHLFYQVPESSAIHNMQRYQNTKEARLGFFIFRPEVPNKGYGAGEDGGPDHKRTLEQLKKVRERLIKYYNIFYDVRAIGEIDYDKEPLFPDNRAITSLVSPETIRLKDSIFNSRGDEVIRIDQGGDMIDLTSPLRKVLARKLPDGTLLDIATGKNLGPLDESNKYYVLHSGESVKIGKPMPFNMYELAESGWIAMVDFALMVFPDDMKNSQILDVREKGEKGGLISEWLSQAGKAKMFEGNHLKNALEPFLTKFIFDVFAHAVATHYYRRSMMVDIIKRLYEVSRTGGLQDFRPYINKVIIKMVNTDSPKSQFYGKGISSNNDAVIDSHVEFIHSRIDNRPSGPYDDMNDNLRPAEDYRFKEMREYADDWWNEEVFQTTGERPPGGPVRSLIKSKITLHKVDDEYHKFITWKKRPPAPINQNTKTGEGVAALKQDEKG